VLEIPDIEHAANAQVLERSPMPSSLLLIFV